VWGSEEVVPVDGLALRVMRTGSGLPVLLVNGLGAAAETWAPLAASLTGLELVAVDLPGTGRTPPLLRPLRMAGLARIVSRLLDVLGHERIDVLGYSFGGVVAQELAWRAPERVSRLVLCATSPGVGSLPPMSLSGLAALIPGRTAGVDAPPSVLGYLHQLYAVSGWTSAPWLRHVRHRTLIVHGEKDRLAPAINARAMAAVMPNARLRIVPGAGHLFLLQTPELVSRELMSFLTPPPTLRHDRHRKDIRALPSL
jgi:poly(3-hydroxyoctanoate) depolymerase